jgi:hypothetical protein
MVLQNKKHMINLLVGVKKLLQEKHQQLMQQGIQLNN